MHSLKLRTNTGKVLLADGTSGPGEYRREIRLRSHNKAIIGFRGTFSPYLTDDGGKQQVPAILDLYVYLAVRLDIITNSDPSGAFESY